MESENGKSVFFNGRQYIIDSYGCLLDPEDWDENFAEGMAAELNLPDGLTEGHWRIIKFIRDTFIELKTCPTIYTTCRQNKLSLKDLRMLFPQGYQRCACRLAGITYREGQLAYYYWDNMEKANKERKKDKIYNTDVNGFLTNPDDWDKNWAFRKAVEMKIGDGLNDKHWDIIEFIRTYFLAKNKIPTVFETCEHFNLEAEELEKLFPDGYHRGAVKLSGLRL